MYKFLHFIYGSRYNAVLLISGITAFSWAMFLGFDTVFVKSQIYQGFAFLGKTVWLTIAWIATVIQISAVATDRLQIKRIAFTLGAFLWAFTAADVWLSSRVEMIVMQYVILALACFFASLDIAFTVKEKENENEPK